MIDALSVTVVVLALLAALGAIVLTVMNKRINWPLLIGLGVVELATLVQLVVGIVRLAGTDTDVSGVTFVIYLVAAVVVLPIGALWALAERSRWGAGVLAVACLVVPVLVLRLDQIWSGA
ncbi:MAG TPA: hypothetical protein VFB74_33850 [Kribbellaceae bacterium]|nr:hypothetical protein [Kribbellaceae bacterium]